MDNEKTADLKALVASVAAGYFSNSHVAASEIPGVIKAIAESLSAVASGGDGGVPSPFTEVAKPVPAVGIRASVKPDRIICLSCGKAQKTLRRHIFTAHGMDPAQYREHWGLKRDYPMVAPAYSEARSQLAKSLGLGKQGQLARGGRKPNNKTIAATPKGQGSTEAPSMTPVRRGAKKKAAAAE
jgi:predicted transcriptional regulator